MDARDVNYVSGIDLPCWMAEDCYMDEDGNLYICFESEHMHIVLDHVIMLTGLFLFPRWYLQNKC